MDSGPLIPSNGRSLPEVRRVPVDYDAQARPAIPLVLPSQQSPLREYVRILVKRRWTVIITVAVIFGIVAIATLRKTRIYDAGGSIAVNKTDPMMVSFKDSSNGGMVYDDTTEVDTEVRVLQSDLLGLQVIKQLKLDRPVTMGSDTDETNSIDQTTDALQPDSPQASTLLSQFKANLKVTQVPGTRLIEIHYRSPDRELAARAVNTLITSYVEQNFKTRFDSTMQASDWLSKQLVDLQIKVETSQEKLVKFQKEHDILGIDEKQNIITSKLDELNKSLTAAEAERMDKESLYRLVQSGDANALAAADLAATQSLGSTTSPLLERLREQHADLKIQVAQLSTQLGPSYPKVVQFENQLKEVDAQIELELNKNLDRVRGGYLAALQRQNMLRDALDKQKQEANKLNESGIEYSLLKRDLETNRSLYENLLQKLKEAGVTAGLRSNNFRIVDVARTPSVPAEPNVPRNLGLGLALGLTTGIGLAFLMEGLDNTVRTPEQAVAICALPSLGMIPLASLNDAEGIKLRLPVTSSQEQVELITQTRPQSQIAESYRALRTSLLLTSLGSPPKVILITSALPQEGKTTTSINCAIVLAQKGGRVLLIDADLRRPGVHKALKLGPRTGLSNVLNGSVPLQQAIVKSALIPSLFVLPAGTPPPNPAELLASTNMRDILEKLREQYEHIVIDTPPALSVTDAVVMSTRADAVILVIRSGKTTKQALARSCDVLARVNARVSGVLLNAADLNSGDYYHYYEYRGKYGNRYYQADVSAGTDASEESASETTSSSA